MISGIQKKISSIIFIFLYCSGYLYAQLPGWVLTRDRDGNTYHIDKQGKIWTSGTPEYKHKAVSISGIDYYLNQGLDLIKNHYVTEGLNILNSILAMPADNDRIYKAQSKAAEAVRKLKKREGPRYTRHIENAPLLLYRTGNSLIMENSIAHYRLRTPFDIVILRTSLRKRHEYLYHGVLAGLRFEVSDKGSKDMHDTFDALLSIDSEKFKSTISSVEELTGHWRIILGDDVYERKELFRNRYRVVNRMHNPAHPPFSGYEGYMAKGRQGYIMRIIFSEGVRDQHRKLLLGIIENLQY